MKACIMQAYAEFLSEYMTEGMPCHVLLFLKPYFEKARLLL